VDVGEENFVTLQELQQAQFQDGDDDPNQPRWVCAKVPPAQNGFAFGNLVKGVAAQFFFVVNPLYSY
jgi:hypothetical protein